MVTDEQVREAVESCRIWKRIKRLRRRRRGWTRPRRGGICGWNGCPQDPATAGIAVMVMTSLSPKNAKALEKDGAAGFFEKSDLMLGTGPSSLLAAVQKVLSNLK